MIVKRFDERSLLVGMQSSHTLTSVQGACDGRKVRGENRIIIPNKSVEKLELFENPDHIRWDGDTRDVWIAVKRARLTRQANVVKIREQIGTDNIRFDYEYNGSYPSIMDHQKILYNLIVYTSGCALLADPGLGKTGPSLWGIDQRMKQGKVKKTLYITLSSLKPNVAAEIAKEIPGRTCVVLKSTDHADKVINKKYKSEKKNLDYDIYIANYESMTNFVDVFLADYFDMVILDEVQRVGNPKSNQTKAIIKKFEHIPYKYILTGTLNANNLMSFFMPFRFMGADFVPYSNYYTYRREYMFTVDPDERIWKPRPGAVDHTAKIIGLNSVTFKVDECLDMPDVKYNRMSCDMEGDQLKAYTKAKSDMIADIEGLCLFCEHLDTCELYKARKTGTDTPDMPCLNPGAIMDSALIQARKLHQIASGFYINSWTDVDDEGREVKRQEVFDFKSNPKMKLIMETIDTVPSDEKILIFGSYTHAIELLVSALRKKYGEKSVVTGYGSDDAFEAVEQFKSSNARFLIGSNKLKTGLNIQFAKYMMFINNDFSFVQREQAIGRCWRKGQTGTVVVYDFISRESIDEHVIGVLDGKKDLSLTLEQWSKILQ